MVRTHFVTQAAREYVAKILDLPWSEGMQDWEVEVSDPDRVIEFARYVRLEKNTNVQLCIFELTLASLEDWFETYEPSQEKTKEIWHTIWPDIREATKRFSDVVQYWSTDGFLISPLLSGIQLLD